MLNSRKPRVGQIRQVSGEEGGDQYMYVITKLDEDYVDLEFLTGKVNGTKHTWELADINEDWVIM